MILLVYVTNVVIYSSNTCGVKGWVYSRCQGNGKTSANVTSWSVSIDRNTGRSEVISCSESKSKRLNSEINWCVCFWPRRQINGAFSMNSDINHEWTKALLRPNGLYPDTSRLWPDRFKMDCRVHLKCVSSERFWWDFASLLTSDFICGETGRCKTERIFMMFFPKLTCKEKSTVLNLRRNICKPYYKSEWLSFRFSCGCMWTLHENMIVFVNSLISSLNDSF